MTPEQTEKFNHILMILGLLVPVLSAIASMVNSSIRKDVAAGKEPSKVLVIVGTLLNFLSINLDKGVQLAKLSAGKPIISTSLPPTGEAPIVTITEEDEKLIAEGKHPTFKRAPPAPTPPVA